MKKIVSLLLVLTMVLSLCACGEKNSGTIESSEKISNDTTITTTPVEPSIETEPVETEEPEEIERIEETPIEENQDIIVSDYEPLNIDYKMCKIGVNETEDSINHFYWVSLDKSGLILEKEYPELSDVWTNLWVYGYNTKDNCKVNINNYSNIDCYSEISANYIETPPLTDANLMSGAGYFVTVVEKKITGENSMCMDDFSFILALIDMKNNFSIMRAQYIKENCSIEEIGVKDTPLYSKNSIISIGDTYYSITEPNFFATPNEADEIKTVGHFFTLTQLTNNGNINDIVIDNDFEIFESLYMEPLSYPEGTTFRTYLSNISVDANGQTTAKVIFEAHNENTFDDYFLTDIDECVVKCNINGKMQYIAIIK